MIVLYKLDTSNVHIPPYRLRSCDFPSVELSREEARATPRLPQEVNPRLKNYVIMCARAREIATDPRIRRYPKTLNAGPRPSLTRGPFLPVSPIAIGRPGSSRDHARRATRSF